MGPLVAILGAGVAALLAFLLDRTDAPEWLDRLLRAAFGLPRRPPPPGSLEDRLVQLQEMMAKSSHLIQQVNLELQAQEATAKKLQEEAKVAEEIVKLTAEAKEAVALLVRDEVTGESRHSFRLSIWVGLLYALAGALVTLAVTLYVHPAYLNDAPPSAPVTSPAPASTGPNH